MSRSGHATNLRPGASPASDWNRALAAAAGGIIASTRNDSGVTGSVRADLRNVGGAP